MSVLAEKVLRHPALAELNAQLASTPRLRWMLYSVFLIFFCYLTLVLDDWRIEYGQEYQRLAARVEKLEAFQGIEQSDFEEFLASEEAKNTALLGKLWRSSSRGLAGAELQSWLRYLASESNLGQVRLNLSDVRPMDDAGSDLWQIKAELSGTFQPSDARRMLELLARSERSVKVETLSYAPFRGDRFSVQLAADFIIEAAEGGR